jgi:hypothetical protein
MNPNGILKKIEHRGWGSFHYESHDNGRTWVFKYSVSSAQKAHNDLIRSEQDRIRRELK